MRKIQMMGIDHSRATVAERELFSLTKSKAEGIDGGSHPAAGRGWLRVAVHL